jgi:ABC-type sulfate transport system substrate-binding protein
MAARHSLMTASIESYCFFSHLDCDPRFNAAATTTFVEHGIGDVLVTLEAEVQSIGSQYGKDKTDLVIPPESLRADFPVAVV